MTQIVIRAAAAACAGAVTCVALLLVSFGHQAVSLDLYRDLPSGMAGVFPAERDGRHAFVWTRGQADFRVPDLDRHVPWSCTVRFRGARPDASTPQPDVAIMVDGVMVSTTHATNDYQTVTVDVRPFPSGRGLTLSIVSTPTFRPSASDPRELGAQLDLLTCQPTTRATPPLHTTIQAAVAAAAIGAGIGLAGVSVVATLCTIVLVATGIAFVLVTGLGSYGTFPSILMWTALWIAGLSAAGQRLFELARRRPLSTGARTAVAATAVILFFNLIGLFHPSKILVDAVFQAHRLEWVLTGRYFFTQQMPNGVQFPYAIGLFVFAAPWSLLTHNHVALLRIVVCATNAVASLLVYRMVVRTWADQFAGAIAALLFGLVPIWFSVVGNANLTNTFGQSVAVIALAGVVTLPLDWRRVLPIVGLLLVVSLAFLSHVSTISLLSATLVAAAGVFWWRGGAAMRTPALIVLAVTVVAAVIAVALYYGHRDFIPVYRALALVKAPVGQQTSPISARTIDGLKQFVDSIGWPIIVLALVGAWRLWADRVRDRLVFVIIASLIVSVAFFAQNLLTPVDTKFERYAAEFLGRVDDATYPALVMLAARGASWSWGMGKGGRVASLTLILAALYVGARSWLGWIQ